GSFAGWLRGIAVNVLRNHLRSVRRAPVVQSLDGQERPAPPNMAVQQRDQAQRIARALAGLPDHYEAVLRAKYLEQQTVEQIAGERQESAKAVESLLTRARQAFRDAFGSLE